MYLHVYLPWSTCCVFREEDNVWIIKPWNLGRGLDIHITDDLVKIVRHSQASPKVRGEEERGGRIGGDGERRGREEGGREGRMEGGREREREVTN